MSKSIKKYISYILLIISLASLVIIYFQSQQIDELRRINENIKSKVDDAFIYSLINANKSIELAESLENLSYIKADAHYDEYKKIFEMAYQDVNQWKEEINHFIILGMDNDKKNNNNTLKYYSSDINNVVMMYRFNNISPVDFSNKWRKALRSTSKLLRDLYKEMDLVKNSSLLYQHKDGVLKRKVIWILEKHLDEIYKINNTEVKRLKYQIESLLEKD